MRLDAYLKEKGMTQAAFGATLTPPASQSLVSQWIRGSTRITLAQALDIEAKTSGDVSPHDCAGHYAGASADQVPA